MSRPAPRLRTRLIVMLLALLAGVCVVLGGLTFVVMRAELTSRVDDQLAGARGRVNSFREHGGRGPGGGPRTGPGAGTGQRDPIEAPGLPPHAVTMLISDGSVRYASHKDEADEVSELPATDQEVLRALPTDGEPRTRSLSTGEYRVVATQSRDGVVLVTGFSLADRDRTLRQQLVTMTLLSLGALALAGLVGTWMIRRAMRPLESMAGVARSVAAMPLTAGAVSISPRVMVPAAQRGTEVGTVGVALDQLLDSVEEALGARHRSEQQVRRFVADASHELRTPVAAIRGYAEMLRLREPLSSEGAQSLDRVENQAVRMSRLVDDLLQLARLDEGRMPEMGEVDLGEVVVEAVTDARVAGQGHRWSMSVPEDPVLVRGDAVQLGQVVANLLSNARKHSDEGSAISCSLAVEGEDAVVTVADDGPGVPAELVGHVFDRFVRADHARSGGDGTTGLGLSIVQAITAAHGGTVGVRSRPGETVFQVRLPLQ